MMWTTDAANCKVCLNSGLLLVLIPIPDSEYMQEKVVVCQRCKLYHDRMNAYGRRREKGR